MKETKKQKRQHTIRARERRARLRGGRPKVLSWKLSPAQRKKIIAAYLAGEPAHSVGKRYGVSIDAVRYHVQKLGLWPGGVRKQPAENRFWPKVKKTKRCWIWTGTRFPNGYGCFKINKKSVGAHRVAYELQKGPIPSGLTIDHLCCNKLCVNPNHLEAVTLGENRRRYYRRKLQKGNPYI